MSDRIRIRRKSDGEHVHIGPWHVAGVAMVEATSLRILLGDLFEITVEEYESTVYGSPVSVSPSAAQAPFLLRLEGLAEFTRVVETVFRPALDGLRVLLADPEFCAAMLDRLHKARESPAADVLRCTQLMGDRDGSPGAPCGARAHGVGAKTNEPRCPRHGGPRPGGT